MVVIEASTSPAMSSRTFPAPSNTRTNNLPPEAPLVSQCASANSFAWEVSSIHPSPRFAASVSAASGRRWTGSGRWQDTMVVFCSDHGDYLGDHWQGEKELFHDCVQHVPFLLYDPSKQADATRGTVEDRFVEAIDVVPTILDGLGLDAAPHLLEGRSLLGLTRGTATAWRDAVVSELDWTFRGARRRIGLPTGQHHAWMLRDAHWKYVHWTSGQRPQLFDLRADPEEFFDLGADPALESVRPAMRERLLTWFTGLKRRTTLTWAEAELRTDRHKSAGVFYGEW